MGKANFHIESNDSIAEIKTRFSHICPNYDINFFTDNEDVHPDLSCAMYSSRVRVGDMNQQFRNESVELNKQMTIKKIERLILDYFKLHVADFVRNIWQSHSF
jgi:hypothetical protein